MNPKVKILVLSGDGLNCEKETAEAFIRAHAQVDILTVRKLLSEPNNLHNYDVLVLPGGFSYADDLGSGSVLALKLLMGLGEQLAQFNRQGKLILGICNGFQVLVRLGLLPFDEYFFSRKAPDVSLAANDSKSFLDTWVKLRVPDNCCLFLKQMKGKAFYLPIRHGEGKIVVRDNKLLQEMKAQGLIAIEYCENVNGSAENIAALTNTRGNILGLMPHPEAALDIELFPERAASEDYSFAKALFEEIVSTARANKNMIKSEESYEQL